MKKMWDDFMMKGGGDNGLKCTSLTNLHTWSKIVFSITAQNSLDYNKLSHETFCGRSSNLSLLGESGKEFQVLIHWMCHVIFTSVW